MSTPRTTSLHFVTLMDAANDLADLLSRENAALEAVDFAGAARHVDAKRRAADAFERAQNATSTLNPPQAAAVREIGERLMSLARTNRALLERGIEVQRRVIGSLARAVPRALNGPRYAASGGPARARSAPPVAFVARA